MPPLRIAVVTETYPPEVNGVATTIAQVVRGLRARGHAVALVRPHQGAADAAARQRGPDGLLTRGLPIPCYPALRLGWPAPRLLLRHWLRQRPDIVHIATEGPLGWSALHAASRLGLPTTSDFRTNFDAYSRHYRAGWLERPIRACLRAFHNRSGCTMVPTDALRRELEAAGFERTCVVARGVDTALFDPARRSEPLRREWGLADGALAAVCVGRLAPEKNLELLFDAHAAMRRAAPSLRLVVVGDGPLASALRARWPDAVFAGERRGDDLAAHYASADLFLFPSLTETFGNVTLEAMASGLPVVAFDYAAAAQLVVPGTNGLLAPYGARAAFIDSAVALAAQPRLRAWGAAARRAALALGWERIVAQVEGVLWRQSLRPAAGVGRAALLPPTDTPASWR